MLRVDLKIAKHNQALSFLHNFVVSRRSRRPSWSFLVRPGAQCGVQLLQIRKCVDDLSSVGRVVGLVIGERSGQRRPDVVDVVDGIVLEVQTLEAGQLDEQINVLPSGQVVVVEPELLELLQMADVLDALDLVVGQVENAKAVQVFQAFDRFQAVVAHVELLQVDQCVQVLQLGNPVGLNAENGQVGQVEALELPDFVFAKVAIIKIAVIL